VPVTIYNGGFKQHNGTFSVGYAPTIVPIIDTGLRLFLNAGNVSSYPGSGTTWFDISGYGNNATLVNGPTYSPYNSGSIVFDGTNDYGTITYNANSFLLGTEDFTMNFWYNRTTTGLYAKIFGIGAYGNPGCLQVGVAANALNRVELIIGQFSNITAETTILTNTWYNMTVRRRSGLASIFMDGSVLSLNGGFGPSASMASSINNTSNPVIGSVGDYFHGKIARIELYKGVALSDTEISASYASLKNTYANIVRTNLTHLFDAGLSSSYSGTGTTWTNLAGSNNLTLVNSPTFVSNGEASRFSLDGTNDFMSGSGYLTGSAAKSHTLNVVMSFNVLPSLSGRYRFFTDTQNPTGYAVQQHSSGQGIGEVQFAQGTTDFNALIYTSFPNQFTPLNTLAMYTFVSKNTGVDFYLNGTLLGGTTANTFVNSSFINATRAYFWGAATSTATNALSMSIAHIMWYSSSLSGTEITQNYNALKGRYGL
jgi:hypothetical protein